MADPVYWEVQCFHLIISLDRTGDGGRIWRGRCMLEAVGKGCVEKPRPISSRALCRLDCRVSAIINYLLWWEFTSVGM